LASVAPKYVWRLGSLPGPDGGAHIAPQSWIKDGDKGRIGRGKDGEREKWVTVGEGKGRGRGGCLTRFTINQCWQVCIRSHYFSNS